MRELFVAVHGQDDNIGDPALRRAMLADLAPGHRRHVLIGHASPAYVKGLSLREDDVTYTTRKEWQPRAFRAAASGRAAYISNAGEIQLNARRRRINLADSALVAAMSARGGVALTTGMGVRSPLAARSRVLSTYAGMCDLATWRDLPSREYVGRGAVLPDWAFALAETSIPRTQARSRLVVSMRGDRVEPSPQWIEAVRSAAEELGLEIHVVTQVARDAGRSAELAQLLGGSLLPWRAGDHRSAEDELREIYRSALLTVSDRLHVLIFAATEGSVPVSAPTTVDTKIERTLAVAGLDELRLELGSTQTEGAARLIEFSSRGAEVERSVAKARQELMALKSRMNSMLGE